MDAERGRPEAPFGKVRRISAYRFLALLILPAALLLAVLGVRAVPVVIVLYIATSVVRWLSMKAKGCGQAG